MTAAGITIVLGRKTGSKATRWVHATEGVVARLGPTIFPATKVRLTCEKLLKGPGIRRVFHADFREIAGTGFCIEVGFTYVSTASSDHRFRFHYLDISRQVYIPDPV